MHDSQAEFGLDFGDDCMMATMAEPGDVFNRTATSDDLKKALAAFWGKLHGVIGRIPFAPQATALYYLIRDPKMSLGVKGTAVLALLYFISPVDAIPDAVPLIGLMDDAAVIASAITILGPLMKPYLARALDWYKAGAKPEVEQEVVKNIEVTQ
jgi:uncharacterized membrane protein YkvA (DUF1232 family)